MLEVGPGYLVKHAEMRLRLKGCDRQQTCLALYAERILNDRKPKCGFWRRLWVTGPERTT